MTDTALQSSNRSAHLGGKANGNTVQTGDHNPAGGHAQHTMPPPEQVDMRAELGALREVLTRLESPERRKIANALSAAEDELTRPQPDKNEVGKALQRTLDYARKAAGFPRIIAVLQLARAGLLPELARQPLPGMQQPRVAVLTPGAHPVEALAGVLARLATDSPAAVAKSQEWAEILRTPGLAGAYDGLSRIAATLPGIATSPLMVCIDQCEELYALCEDPEAQNVFVANLLHAAADRAARVSVILTLRSDCLAHTQRHAALNQAIAAHGVIVPEMDAAALRLAIAEPAARANHPFDAATVDRLLAATAEQAGALPLLQFTLTRIWEWLAQGVAPADTLRHLGGVSGALAGEAQRLYDSLSEADKAIAQRAFVGLVRLDAGMPDTRRRVAVADLTAPGDNPDSIRQVLRLLARPGTRLMSFTADLDGTEMVELTHDVLLEHWEALRTCLARRRADLHVPPRGDNKVGDTLAATGDPAAALEQYRKGLAIREGLATAEPTNAQAQRDVAVSHSKTGLTAPGPYSGSEALGGAEEQSSTRQMIHTPTTRWRAHRNDAREVRHEPEILS